MLTIFRWAAAVAGALVLAACNNSGSGNSSGSTPPPTSTTYTVGGTVSGVTGSGLVLSNNGTTLPVGSGDSTFTFTGGLATGTAYDVTVQSAPAGLLCSVASGSGTIGSSNVTNIAVTCTAQNHSVGGTISGLKADGLVLANNGASVTLNSGTTQFTFTTLIATGTPYAVTVQAAPAGYTCSVANGSGTMGTADISNVVVTCSTQSYPVGGTISGFTSTGLVLANGTDRITPATNATSFTMPTPVASTSSYAVTVAVQPAGMSCSVANGSGTVGNSAVTNIAVTCTDQSYTLGGTVAGLTASGLVLANGADTVTVAANAGSFTFPTSVAFGASYAVTVSVQPMGLTCSVSGGTGTMAANNVNNVAVTCSPVTYTLGGSISGLTVTGLVLANSNNTDKVTVAANATSFVLPTALAAATPYSVTVSTQPNGWMCTVSGGSGNMPAANVTSVQVTCALRAYTLGGTITGLADSGLVLTDGTDHVSVAANATTFSMPTGVVFGSPYTVTVQTQPVAAKCTVTNGTGTMPAQNNMTSVQVTCTAFEWTWVAGSDTPGAVNSTVVPGARDSQMTWKDSAGNFWMFGGEFANATSAGTYDDVWEYSPGTNQWTYVTGDTALNPPGNYSGATESPGGRQAGMVWTDGTGNVWLFGGFGIDSAGNNPVVLSDLWKFNMLSRTWTLVGGPTVGGQAGSYGTLGSFNTTNWPHARLGSSTWTDSGGRLWMFGGSDSGATYNDVWVFDPKLGTAGEWAWVAGSNTAGSAGTSGTQGTGASGNIPGARYGAMTWTDATGKIWLFGGATPDALASNGSDYFNDLWVYDPTTTYWTWMSGTTTKSTAPGTYGTKGTFAAGNQPGARGGAVAWVDTSGKLWMFGGFGFGSGAADSYLNDLWVYDTASQQWAWIGGSNTAGPNTGNYGSLGVAAATNQPGSRLAARGWTDTNGNFWLFGGLSADSVGNAVDLSDLWMY